MFTFAIKKKGMEKVQISGILITLDIFKCSVLVLVGKDEDSIIEELPELYKYNGWKAPDRTIELIKKDHCDEDNEDLYQGRTIPDGVDAFVIFLADSLAEVSEETALHELGHAMRHILRVHGVNDEETEMYTHEYLFHEFLCAQDSYSKGNVEKFEVERK